jgi:hypothetical protein
MFRFFKKRTEPDDISNALTPEQRAAAEMKLIKLQAEEQERYARYKEVKQFYLEQYRTLSKEDLLWESVLHLQSDVSMLISLKMRGNENAPASALTEVLASYSKIQNFDDES